MRDAHAFGSLPAITCSSMYESMTKKVDPKEQVNRLWLKPYLVNACETFVYQFLNVICRNCHEHFLIELSTIIE